MTTSGMKRALLGALLLAIVGAVPAAAQNQWFSLAYGVSLPSDGTKDFTDNTSWRNLSADYSWFTTRNIAIGFNAAWSVFVERVPDETASLEGVDVTGTQVRYVNAFPMLLTVHRYLGQPGGIRPYLGAGVGTYFVEERLEIGVVALTADAWHFGLAPEAGLIVPVGWRARALLQAKYNWALKANEIEHTYWTFNIGFAFQ